jgi:hypothetical protein
LGADLTVLGENLEGSHIYVHSRPEKAEGFENPRDDLLIGCLSCRVSKLKVGKRHERNPADLMNEK